MRLRGDDRADGPSGEHLPGGLSDRARHTLDSVVDDMTPGTPLEEDAALAEKLDVQPERGDVKG